MSRKQWAVLALLLLLVSLGGMAASVVLIDPFEIYHQADAFIPPITNGTQNYSNAGIAKSYDYDSVVIGSSMTENFTPSQLDRLLGGQFVKLPINGGSPFNHRQMMEMAFRTHDVKRILYGIDIEALTYFYTTPKCEMPDYLYDDNLFNDTAYWFNSSVLLKYIPACLKTLGQTDPDQRDTMYNWGSLYDYGRDAVLRNLPETPVAAAQTPAASVLSQQSMLNIQHNYIPFIEAHPDTEFIFFYPPYSLARWYEFYRDDVLLYHLAQKEAITQALLPYPNVKIFDFQANTDWFLDFDNYIDPGHYGPWINDAMAEAIAEGRERVTSCEQIRENNAVIIEQVNQLVASGVWPDSN